MSIHYAILADLSTFSKDAASMEVSAALAGAADFTVFPPGNPPKPPVSVPLNGDLFASSVSAVKNLFSLCNFQTSIVKADVAANGSGATLRQQTGGTEILVPVPEAGIAMGTAFSFPFGDVAVGSAILVGNPSGGPATVHVVFGNSLPAPAISVPAMGVAKIPIKDPKMRVRVTIDVPVLVQVVMDVGNVMVVLPD